MLNGPFGLETGDAVSAQLTIDHSLTDGTFSIDALKGIDSGTSLKFFMGTAVYTEMEELGFGFGWPTVTLANGRWIDADYQGNLADGGTIYRLGVLHNGQPGFDWTIIDVTADPTGPAPSAVSDAAGVFEFQIPEPASLVLLIGALGLFGLRRRVMRRACIS